MSSYRSDIYDQDISVGVLQAGLVEVYAWLDTDEGKSGNCAPEMLSRAFARMKEAEDLYQRNKQVDSRNPRSSQQPA